MRKRIGITGGIGSGKSVVSALLRVMGIPVYDADAASKTLLTTDDGLMASLKSLLGEDVYNGNLLDKKRMASLIFSDRRLLEEVNALVHPAVIADFEKWSGRMDSPMVACESALVFEAGMKPLFDAVLMVYSPEQLRVKRSVARDNVTEEQVRMRIANQMPDERKRELSDFVILNDESHALIPQLRGVLARL